MRDTLGESLRNLKWVQIRKKRLSALLLMLSVVVAFQVFWSLRQPGLTLAGDASCGILEHTHGDECYGERCICDVSEETHTHTDECYIQELLCEWEEHVHTLECYSDASADVETMLDWQEMFAAYPYTGDLREDLVGIAKTQVGYSESTLNFEVGSDGIRRGYTRYGAWYGTPYRDWSAAFVSFCLTYAKADVQETPINTGAFTMKDLWKELDKYAPVEEYTPVPGDLVFFIDNTVGIVAEIQNTTFCVVRGDMDGMVQSDMILLTDPSILGWGVTTGTIRETNGPDPPDLSEPPDIPETPNEQEEQEPLELETEDDTEIPPEMEVEEESEPPPEVEVEEESEPPPEVDRDLLLDVSNGPAVFLFENGEMLPQRQRYSLRLGRSVTDLVPYLEANGGSYFFTLLDKNNQELAKDENGNYVVIADTGYKLTISFTAPEGFLPGTYQYQVPNGLIVDGGAGSFILKDGTNVGDWSVSDDGLITLVFNDHINSRTDITISATMGTHFPIQDEPIDFDGKISVTVQEPPVESQTTKITKWGIQGDPDTEGKTDPDRIYWNVNIVGMKDSQIPGSTITDKVIHGAWIGDQHYSQRDMAEGLRFGASDPDWNWHGWTVYPGDPGLTWTESGWSYQMPESIQCWCGEVLLGNEGWVYYIDYSSTPDMVGTAGTLYYMNRITVDNQYTEGGASFSHGEILGVVEKEGTFLADATGGAFLWEFRATIPGRQTGQKAEYHWYLMDYLYLINSEGYLAGPVENEANLAVVTATYNGTTIIVPQIRDATENDPFAWDNAWTASNNGVNYGREINLLCRCQCNEENCQFWNGDCQEYWYEKEDGTWDTNGYCQCWTPQENVTFTFIYKTTDLALVENYGSLGYQLLNVAELYYRPNGTPEGALVTSAQAYVPIPGLFEKTLTHDFDGYTAHYRVTVNEAKLVLTNGLPLTIHDEMTQTLAYISGSLVITTEDVNGNQTTLKQNIDYTVTYDGTGIKTDQYGNPVHVLDIVILRPQPVMYILDYDTTLILPEQVTEGIRYSNSATITLWGEDITDNSVEKVYAEINIAAKSYKIEMFKTCAQTGEPLPGATFGLYNTQGGLITTEVTGEGGALLFQTNIIEGIILREHVLYYMQEIKAPAGYQLDDTKYWFCFCNSTEDSCATCHQVMAGLDAYRIPFEQVGKVHITNEIMHYDLPATGGPGIYPLMLASVSCIVTPLVYGSIRRRKRERRGVG